VRLRYRKHVKEHRLAPLGYRALLAAVTAVPLALTAACGGGGNAAPVGALAGAPGGRIPAGPAPGPQSLSEAGSTLLNPLMVNWARAYQQQHPNVRITTAPIGSGKGIAAAAAGRVDIGASDAYLSSGTLVQHPALLNIPLAISAQQVNYNVPGVGRGVHLRLSGKVLAEMYQGLIRTWNDPRIAKLNSGVRLPAVPVVPVHRFDSSGDTFLFTSYLSNHDSGWNHNYGYGTTVAWPPVAGARTATSNGQMVTVCAATRGCVAYIGIAYLSTASAAGLGEAQLQNTAGSWELPNQASIVAATASFVSSTPTNETISMVNGPAAAGYPIVNYEYAIVSTRQPDAAKARDIKAFLHWAITRGNAAQFLNAVQFQPLPGPIETLSDAQIAKIG
jgi:phosphate transport system substrate-binding protein